MMTMFPGELYEIRKSNFFVSPDYVPFVTFDGQINVISGHVLILVYCSSYNDRLRRLGFIYNGILVQRIFDNEQIKSWFKNIE